MYDRCTDRFRKAMALAEHQARQFGHEYIGTEHILLGLIEENTGVAVNVLKNLGINLHKVSREIRLIVPHLPKISTTDRLPQTPRSKKAIEYAIEECRVLKHNYVGTEHLLLGLLRERDGVAAQVLMNLGLKLEDGRKEVLNLLGFPKPETAEEIAADVVAGESLDEPIKSPGSGVHPLSDIFGRGNLDIQIRQAIQFLWSRLPRERRSTAEVEAQLRRLVDRALRDFREDLQMFGEGGPSEPAPQ